MFSCHPSYSNTLSFHHLITKPQNFKGKCVLSEKELQQSNVLLQSEMGLVCEHQGCSPVVCLSTSQETDIKQSPKTLIKHPHKLYLNTVILVILVHSPLLILVLQLFWHSGPQNILWMRVALAYLLMFWVNRSVCRDLQ